jgi:hypothetical protein
LPSVGGSPLADECRDGSFQPGDFLIVSPSRIQPVVKHLLRVAKAGFTVEEALAAIAKPTWQWDGYFQKR